MISFSKNVNELTFGEVEKAIQNESILFFLENGDLIQLEYYRKKTKNGTILYYYMDKNDQIYGEFYAYYPNNQLFICTYYLNNKIHGKSEIYDMNGNKRSSTIYINGILEGEAYHYDTNGNIVVYDQYKNGILNGLSKRYCLSGCCVDYLYYENDIIKHIDRYVHHNLVKSFDLTEEESKEYDRIMDDHSLFYEISLQKSVRLNCNYTIHKNKSKKQK